MFIFKYNVPDDLPMHTASIRLVRNKKRREPREMGPVLKFILHVVFDGELLVYTEHICTKSELNRSMV